MNIEINYDGKWPNLCSGKLVVTIDNIIYEFPDFCLYSGGRAYFSNGYRDEHIEKGQWSIDRWPKGFPEELKEEVLSAINGKISWGCCGGCL